MAIISMEYSPKRKKRLLTTFLDLCRTQWVERHAAQEVFLALFLSILRVLEAMSNERLFENQFGETAWNWDTDSKSKANGLLHALHKVEFIITLLTTMKCSSILKPLSIKLQKREINVFQAYNPIKDFKSNLLDISEETSRNIYPAARKADITPSMPRTVGQQQRQSSVEAETSKDYYKRSLTVPL